MRRVTIKLIIIISGVLFTALFCEYIIYYVVAAQCYWPSLNVSDPETIVKAFILSDTHLLGPRKGYWVDKWRREWQMHQAYNAIITLHKPDVIFILGDLFDEGEWSNEKQFRDYVDRFHKLFPVPEDSVMHIVAGNHDIGFHNFIRKGSAQRFIKMLNSSLVQFISMKNNHFVLINSMAMEGDGCNMCAKATNDVIKIAGILRCAENPAFCYDGVMKINYTKPILMQHFPLFRLSDGDCTEDGPPQDERYKPFRNKIDSISAEATEFLATKLKPRVVFGGHTHHSCLLHHKYKGPEKEPIEFYEYSIPSFSWRNRPNPKYMLVSITPNDYAVNKCGLPLEFTIVITALLMLSLIIWQTKRRRCFGP